MELEELRIVFPYWEKTKDIIDQLIDIILNYRQSGHPGGSRSKVHALLTLMLSGAMRWDIRNPEKRFSDRFVLGAGHTVPLVYCALAVLNQALRIKYQQTHDERYAFPHPERVLYWEDLLGFRRRGGLSGHAEMGGKTLFLKFNTGPSGHGIPVALGEAVALKRAGAGEVRVFVMDGETGLTAGGALESLNSAWGLALDNLYFLLDWNDFGIDDHATSQVIYGTPSLWFSSRGWQAFGAEYGSEWTDLVEALLQMLNAPNPQKTPSALWFKTRKGREYLKYDNKSHGSPHPMDSDSFWQTKKPFAEKYGVQFMSYGKPAPQGPEVIREEFESNLRTVIQVLESDQALVDYLANTLVAMGEQIPEQIPTFSLGRKGNPFEDARLYDYGNYPSDLYAQPGKRLANRAAFGKWGAWVNAFGASEYGRPLFLACSADLAGSTNISGFAEGYGDFKGYGWYERVGDPQGVLLPQEITEFTNAGITAGLSSTNLAENPEKGFDGFWGACSTYGSFSYLKYGPLRLFSQLAQDCQLKVGKLIWVIGHSGPETADDSRTHFGIFAPGVTQLFPEGQVINLHPWEYNEVPVLLGAALRLDVPIIALHLTRPPVDIPDRQRLGIPSHFEAARGAYVVRDYHPERPRQAAFIVQGTSAMANMVQILPEIERENLNIKVIYASSYQLFKRQPRDYQDQVLDTFDQRHSTIISTQARVTMYDWLFTRISKEYAMTADWDNRWRTGGTLEEVVEEAHLSPDYLIVGIEKFIQALSHQE
jgi:transketolase